MIKDFCYQQFKLRRTQKDFVKKYNKSFRTLVITNNNYNN